MIPTTWRVIGCTGCGSTLVEAALVLAGISYEREEVDYTTAGPGRDRLLALNPLAQVPVVIAPDGGVLTESAAIVLHLDELAPAAHLLPPAGDPRRREALRWLVFFVAAIYPTFTYGDDPAKWVGDAGERLRASTLAHRQRLWQQVATAAKTPWLLGATHSILDVYVAVMTRWTPGRAWFTEHTPRLAEIGSAVEADPRLRPLFQAN